MNSLEKIQDSEGVSLEPGVVEGVEETEYKVTIDGEDGLEGELPARYLYIEATAPAPTRSASESRVARFMKGMLR